ncbi:MAG: hypothetical protein M3R61_01020 [Chloroflexota bacterium]|nr:hypothetical protein [Chloroflexota bacterium]
MSLDIPGLLLISGLNLVIYAAWLACFLTNSWNLAEAGLAAAVGWCAQVALSQMLLGLFGLLAPAWLGLLNMLITSVVVLAAWRGRRAPPAQLGRTLAHTAYAAVRGVPASVLALLLAAWLGWTIFLGLIFPPYAFDEHYYHMPIVATIIQSQRIGPIASANPWIAAYPKNGELFTVWSSIWLHRDSLADLSMVPFALIGALAVYAAGRRLGALPGQALLGSAVFCFAPNTLIIMKTTYNDLMVGGLWAAAICFAVPAGTRAGPGPRATSLLLGLLSGLILGIKYSGPLYAVALALLLLPLLLRAEDLRQAAQMLALFAGGTLMAGGYWYTLNWVSFGNPLFPFPMRVAGYTVFPGTVDRDTIEGSDISLKVVGSLPGWRRLLYAWFDRDSGFSIDSRLAGLGPLWICMGLPCALLWAGRSIARRAWRPLAVLAAHALVLALLPFNWIPRYELFLLALGGCAVAAVAQELKPWALSWMQIVCVALALFAVLNSVDQTYFTVGRIRAFAALQDDQRTGMQFDPSTFGPTYQAVARLVPAGGTLAYGNSVALIYPLWGARFERRVISVITTDAQQYVDDLRAAGAQYVFVRVDSRQAAALAGDQRARLLFDGGDGLRLFEVR